MPQDWTPLEIGKPLFANLDPDAVIGYQTALENAFQNELGGLTRFPGLREFTTVDAQAKRLYLHEFNEDLIAASDKGQVYRIDKQGNVENVTAVSVSGGRRVIFAETDRDLLMCAGGPIVRLRDTKTELLASSAPNASHVGWLDNFTIAVEVNSGRWFHSRPGQPDIWDALDTFSADSNPDNITGMIVTPFRELLLGGVDSTEQFERTASGDAAFYRRWAIGDGMRLPYTQVFADNQTWTINALFELVKVSGQRSASVSQTFQKLLEQIDDWSDAWMGGYPNNPLSILGQRFILLQMPNATNEYGTKGVTLVYDYRNNKPFFLYGWDNQKGVPARWPGWSHWKLWGKTYVGGSDGKIYEITEDTYRNGSALQRLLVRTSHMAQGSGVTVNGFRLRLVRGKGGSDTASTIRVRCSRDARPFGPWITRSLGAAGQRQQFIEFGSFGNGATFQFEISSADDCAVNLIGADVKLLPLGH